MNKKFGKFIWFIPIALALITYWPALNNGIVYDDIYIFKVHLPRLTHMSEIWSYYSILAKGSSYYHPIFYMSFILTRYFSGYNPWGYHLVLLILHTLNTVLVYRLSLEFLRGKNAAKLGALAAATLFAVHPIHAEVVAWISGTAEALLTFFFLLALLFFILFRSKPKRKLWLVLSGMSFLLALFTKETAVTFLGVVVLYDVLIVKPLAQKPAFLKTPYIVYFTSLIFYLGVRFLNIHSNPFQTFTMTWGDGVIKIISAIGYYLQKILWPHVLNPYIATVPSSTGFVLGSLILLIIVIFACIYTVKYNRLLLFHILFFIVTLLPGVLVVISSASNTPLAERYLYLPSYGFCFLFGWFMTLRLADARSLRLRSGQVGRNIIQSVKIFIWIVILLVSGIISHDSVKIWQDDWTFWRHTARLNPQSMVPWGKLATLYFEQHNCPKAVTYYKKAFSLKITEALPKVSGLYSNMASCFFMAGDFDQAEIIYKKAIQIYPNPNAFFNLGLLYHDQAEHLPAQKQKRYYKKALQSIEEAFIRDRENVKYSYFMGKLTESLGDIGQAKRYYQISLEHPKQSEWKQKAKQALDRLNK